MTSRDFPQFPLPNIGVAGTGFPPQLLVNVGSLTSVSRVCVATTLLAEPSPAVPRNASLQSCSVPHNTQEPVGGSLI